MYIFVIVSSVIIVYLGYFACTRDPRYDRISYFADQDGYDFDTHYTRMKSVHRELKKND